MAILHCTANGNWTTAGTWGLCNATASLDSQVSNTLLTTTFVSSSAFTPGAITVDGIAVKVATRALTPSGTISIRLAQAGVAVTGTTVTINVSDIPDDVGSAGNSYIGCSIGWVFFKFSSPVTLAAATAYTLQCSTSATNQVNLFRDGTANNWSRLVRTTTTQAPAAGDDLFIGGEWTAAATVTSRTVTIDSTATTDYGGGNTVTAGVGVSKGGTLTLGTSASTAYILRLSAILAAWLESTVEFGTSGTPLPATSTFDLQFDCTADNNFGIVAYIDLLFYGADKWGTGIARTILTADAAAAATSLTVADNTGWLSGETIAIAPTARVANQGEERVLNGNAGASSMSITAGLTNAHQGNATWEAQADVINVTRNLTVTTVSTFCWFLYQRNGGDITASWARFQNMGNTSRGGFDLDSGTFAFTDCAFTDSKDDVLQPSSASVSTFTLTRCVSWRCINTTAGSIIQGSGSATLTVTVTDCTFIGSGVNSSIAIYLNGSDTLTLTGTRIAGNDVAIRMDTGLDSVVIEDSDFYTNNGTNGAVLVNTGNAFVRIRRCKFWRNGSAGALTVTGSYDVEVEECSFYGNGSPNIQWTTSVGRILNCVVASETSYTTNVGININPSSLQGSTELQIHGGTFSEVTGNRIAHATLDIQCTITTSRFRLLVSGVPIPSGFSTTTFADGTEVAFQREDDTADIHWFRRYGYGRLDIETTTVGDASPSMKMAPENVYRKFESNLFTKAVGIGETVTFTAKVRKNGTYNGNAPRLVLKANGAIGVPQDVVLDTHTAAADTWEELTGSMPAAAQEDGVAGIVIDCDGTAGAIFVDDLTATVA